MRRLVGLLVAAVFAIVIASDAVAVDIGGIEVIMLKRAPQAGEEAPAPETAYAKDRRAKIIANIERDGRIETCHFRGCQSMVADAMQFIDRTYAFYDASYTVGRAADLPTPEVHFVSRAALAKKACVSERCDAIGWFPNKGNVIYIASDQDVVGNLHSRSIMVHELVHYVQHNLGLAKSESKCLSWKAREMQAYGIQHHWLRANRVRIRTPAYNMRLASFSRMRCDEASHDREHGHLHAGEPQ